LNIAAVDLADLIGVNAVRSYALRFGLELSAQDANLALALGSMTEGVSPAALCGAYASLSNGGIGIQPHHSLQLLRLRLLDSPGCFITHPTLLTLSFSSQHDTAPLRYRHISTTYPYRPVTVI